MPMLPTRVARGLISPWIEATRRLLRRYFFAEPAESVGLKVLHGIGFNEPDGDQG